MRASYDPPLVVVSVLIAVFASYVALDLTARLSAAGRSTGPRGLQVTWGLGGAMAMGTGIWSMHFIAMLALRLPTPVRYDLAITIASVLPAIAASGLALFVSSRPHVSQRSVLLGGLVMGTGITAMHYTGMAAIVVPVGVHYHAPLYWLSVAIAVAASWGALTLAFVLRGHEGLWMPRRALAAVIMGAAIAGMHYTGMAAAQFPITGLDTRAGLPEGVLATRGLAVAVCISSVSILALALAGAAVSVRVNRQESARRVRTEQLLRGAAEALAATGPDFFRTALAELLRALGATTGIIARVEDDAAHSVVLIRDGVVVDDVTIALEGSLFAHVMSTPGIHCVPERVGERFRQPWMGDTHLAGYIGTPIHDGDGRLTGLIAALTPSPLHERGEAEALLQIFGTRVAGEMQQARTKAALFQAEKMDAIGKLAGGVAHDFNNLLTIILGYADDLRETTGPESREAIDAVLSAADRASQLTHQLLAFSRSQVLQPRAVALDEIVASMETMLRRIIGEDVSFTVKSGAAGSAISADPSQLSQVLLNLAVNARDAMPKGGALTIATDRQTVDRAIVQDRGRAIPPGRYVRLIVRDTGHGMDAATRDRLFEPFFSTKGTSGTGLGLATVYGIVRQSGGFIHCDSRVGQGTTFTIHLPETDQPVAAPEPGRAAPPVRRGRESVLIVEDEPAVRQFLESALTRRGYAARTAGSAAEALALLRAGWHPDVLMTDFVLPEGMNGLDLIAHALVLAPDVKPLLISGYAKEPAEVGATVPAHAFLAKPFTPDALCAKILDILGNEPERSG